MRRGPKPRPILDRLADKFTVGDGCWEWTAATDSHGYGAFGDAGRVVRAHRAVYALFLPLADTDSLDHICRNTSCVRPAHLEPVTHAENVRRGWASRGATDVRRGRPTCRSGHPWTAENTGRDPDGYRRCRACDRDLQARRRAARPLSN